MGFVAMVCQPSILRRTIWPEARRAQNSMAAVSAEGSTVWVLMRRLNSSCSRSMMFVERALHKHHRATARGVQTPHQDPDRAAFGRYRRHAVLGSPRFRPDRPAQDRWLADHGHKAHRSAD